MCERENQGSSSLCVLKLEDLPPHHRNLQYKRTREEGNGYKNSSHLLWSGLGDIVLTICTARHSIPAFRGKKNLTPFFTFQLCPRANPFLLARALKLYACHTPRSAMLFMRMRYALCTPRRSACVCVSTKNSSCLECLAKRIASQSSFF